MISRGEMVLLPYGVLMLAGPILDLAIVAGVPAILRRPLAGFAAGSGFLAQGHLSDFRPTGSTWITGGTIGPGGSLYAFLAMLCAFGLLIALGARLLSALRSGTVQIDRALPLFVSRDCWIPHIDAWEALC